VTLAPGLSRPDLPAMSGIHLLRRDPMSELVKGWTPKSQLGLSIFKTLRYLPEELALELLDRIQSVAVIESSLKLVVFRANGKVEDVGEVSRKVVTDTGVGFIVDAFQNLKELENMKFHGIGTGTGAEAVGNTALGTELTTQYNPDNTRATGSTGETSANIYRTVGTNTVDASATISEHGIFDQAATGGGVLLDRSMFSGSSVGLTSGDSLQSTYDFTLTSGG
jgi:hypothetical protein